jgi:biopolymer transport protein ExbD
MKYVLEVCLVALALTITNAPRVAAQTMQQGVSVQLPVTSNAVPMPDADQPNAPIVSVTADGGVYLGVDPISPTALAEKVKDSLLNQPDKRLYIKADARAPYGDVVKILDAVRNADVGAVTLLTAQPESSPAGTRVPPTGLQVFAGPPPACASDKKTRLW